MRHLLKQLKIYYTSILIKCQYLGNYNSGVSRHNSEFVSVLKVKIDGSNIEAIATICQLIKTFFSFLV